MPSYTTRMMLSFLLLALLAVSLGVGSTYRIRASLEKMQVEFDKNSEQLILALDLNKAVKKRSRVETLYLSTRNRSYLQAWRRADNEFSRVLGNLDKIKNAKASLSALNSISRANDKVRDGWFRLTADTSARMPDAHAARAIERLESSINDYAETSSRLTNVAEEAALRSTNETLFGNLLFSGFVLGLAAVMAIYISNTLRHPLADLLAATQKITDGQLGHRIDLSRADEIGALTAAFDEMSSQLLRKDIQITGQLEQLQKAKSLLETYSQDLEMKNKEMESFIYSVSHDLKAPLIAIQGFLAMFADEFSSTLSDKARFYLQRVQANGQHMQTLIQQLLELSRAGQSTGHLTAVATKQLVEQVLDDLHLQIEAKHAEVTMEGDWPSVVAEPTRLKQALTNLIDNALHYGQEKVPVKIDMAIEDHEDVWRFYVRDNGIGIDPLYQSKVFDMFERLSNSHEKNANGTGIGLAIVKKIAESHGGTVGVKSKLDQGATFYFEISKDLKPGGKTTVEVRA